MKKGSKSSKKQNIFNKIIDYVKNNKKRVIIISSIFLVLIIILIVLLSINSNKKVDSAIDENLSTYQGKKIKKKNGDIIIEEENGSKTVETAKKDSEFTETNDKIKKQFVIDDISVKKNGTSTIVKGNIKNKSSKYSDLYVNVKFYSDDEVIGSSSSLIEDLKKGKSTDFKINILGDFSNKKYEVIVEYVK